MLVSCFVTVAIFSSCPITPYYFLLNPVFQDSVLLFPRIQLSTYLLIDTFHPIIYLSHLATNIYLCTYTPQMTVILPQIITIPVLVNSIEFECSKQNTAKLECVCYINNHVIAFIHT